MSKKQNFFSLFIEFLGAENRPSQKNYNRPKQKSKKSAKPTISPEVKNYRFASDQNANEALKSIDLNRSIDFNASMIFK